MIESVLKTAAARRNRPDESRRQVGFRNRPGWSIFTAATTSTALADVSSSQPETLQPGRQSEPHVEIVKAARRVAHAERALDARHGVGRRGALKPMA